MDQLSSCYFCGGALDVSLAEYPVVPETLRPADAQQTVVLCGSCKRKLDAVVDRVVAVADDQTAEALDAETETESPAGAPTDGPSNAESGPASGSEDGERPTGADIESTLGDDEDVLQPVGDRSNSSASNGSSPDDGGQNGSDPSGDASSDDSEPETERKEKKYTSSRRAGYTGEESTDSADGGSDDAGSDRSTSDAEDDDAGQSDADGVTMTRLENTKVMRLLQNREFPVEREGFVTVASSAYEVSAADCDKVIDLAIQHDLLREDGDQIVAGPKWG